jgi:hypothetical protein
MCVNTKKTDWCKKCRTKRISGNSWLTACDEAMRVGQVGRCSRGLETEKIETYKSTCDACKAKKKKYSAGF